MPKTMNLIEICYVCGLHKSMAAPTASVSRPVHLWTVSMKGEITAETPIEAPADVMWAAYRGKELGLLVNKLLGDTVGRVEFEGDGGVGTVVKLTFPPGTPGPGYMKELFVVQDDERRLKVTEQIEGGYRALGFDLYRIKLEIVEKDSASSIVQSSIEYELDDSLAELVSHVSTQALETIAHAVGRHLLETKVK